jgi:hypothetical protein
LQFDMFYGCVLHIDTSSYHFALGWTKHDAQRAIVSPRAHVKLQHDMRHLQHERGSLNIAENHAIRSPRARKMSAPYPTKLPTEEPSSPANM